MNEDLKWLAENVHEWKHESCDLIRRNGKSQAWYGESKNHLYPREEYYTRDQWQAVRDELSGKPSWDIVNGEWIAQDSDGVWYSFDNEPYHGKDCWDANPCYREQYGCGQVLGDWRNTLERRPESHSVEPTEKVWRGPKDGLPPIGLTVLNWTNEKCTVIAHDNGNIVCRIEESHGGYRGYTPEQVKTRLRPLHSEEDKVVNKMLSVWKRENPMLGDTMQEQYARQLYRAGLRFNESKYV